LEMPAALSGYHLAGLRWALAVQLELVGVLEQVPDNPRDGVLILRCKIIDVWSDQLEDVAAGEHIDPWAEGLVDLQGEGIAEIENIALGEVSFRGVAIADHSCVFQLESEGRSDIDH
jgi:hypothetical protein